MPIIDNYRTKDKGTVHIFNVDFEFSEQFRNMHYSDKKNHVIWSYIPVMFL